jgi:hypothetical protein
MNIINEIRINEFLVNFKNIIFILVFLISNMTHIHETKATTTNNYKPARVSNPLLKANVIKVPQQFTISKEIK